jgi:leucyl-tRNA synthetase
MWEGLGMEGLIYHAKWPTFDPAALVKDSVEIVVQINGKIREKLDVPSGLLKEDFEKTVLEDASVKALTDGHNIVKVVAVPDKLVNIVIKG